MTKRKVISLLKGVGIVVIIVVVMATIVFAAVWLDEKEEKNQAEEKAATYNAEIITNEAYSLFQTNDVQEYLDFLESFDETKYEIIDISTSMEHVSKFTGNSEFYMVTYKTIAE